MSDAIIERVTNMIAPLVADLHLDLYDIEFRGGVLRVTLDTPPGSDAGVDIDTLALVTRMISRDFDHDDPMPGHYTLEVTSPGLERTLRTPTHFQREVGKVVAIRLRDIGGTDRRVQGTLVSANETECVVAPNPTTRPRPARRTTPRPPSRRNAPSSTPRSTAPRPCSSGGRRPSRASKQAKSPARSRPSNPAARPRPVLTTRSTLSTTSTRSTRLLTPTSRHPPRRRRHE